MRLRYAPRARRDLEAIHAHIAERSPEAALRFIAAIRAACELIAEFPAIGRDTDMAGVRVLAAARLSYLVYHRLHVGFDLVAEENLREFAIAYFRGVHRNSAGSTAPPPLGLHLLTGANSGEKFANYLKALEAHQIEPVILVARRR